MGDPSSGFLQVQNTFGALPAVLDLGFASVFVPFVLIPFSFSVTSFWDDEPGLLRRTRVDDMAVRDKLRGNLALSICRKGASSCL